MFHFFYLLHHFFSDGGLSLLIIVDADMGKADFGEISDNLPQCRGAESKR